VVFQNNLISFIRFAFNILQSIAGEC